MSTSSAALQKAMSEGVAHVPEGSRKGALAAAVSKIETFQKRTATMRAHAQDAGLVVAHTVETSGAAFLGGMAEGYWGRDKLLVGGFDARIGAGLAGRGWDLYQTLQGRTDGHVGAIAQGLLDAGLVSMGLDAGRKVRDAKANPAAPPAPAVPAVRGAMRELSLSGPTPGPERVVERGGRRFVDVPLS